VTKVSDLLTLPEAAAIAGLSPVTLRVQVFNGRLAARKIGRDWVVTRRELERYMAEVSRTATDPEGE
jgi:hypothetical protein